MCTFEKVPARCRVNKWHCGTNERRQASGQEGKTKLFVTKLNIHSLSLALTLAPTLTLTATLSLTSDNQMSIAQTHACAVDYHSTHAQSTYLWCTEASVTMATDLEFGSTSDLHDVCDVYPAPSTSLLKNFPPRRGEIVTKQFSAPFNSPREKQHGLYTFTLLSMPMLIKGELTFSNYAHS